MEIDSYSASVDHDDYFENSDDRQVKIINGTYAEYFDLVNEKSGALEIIKTDGTNILLIPLLMAMTKAKPKIVLNILTVQ